MRVTYPFQYTSHFRPLSPSGKIDLRFKSVSFISTGRVFFDIPELTGDQAPVAIRQHTTECRKTDKIDPNGRVDRTCDPPAYEYLYEDHAVTVEYRAFNGKLYTTVNASQLWSRSHDGEYEIKLPDTSRRYSWRHPRQHVFDESCDHSKTRRVYEIEQKLLSYLIIDGKLYKEAAEPRYEVMTFGLGGNHGGTSIHVAYGFNGNLSWKQYFRIDKYAEALAYATKVADRRGDTINRTFETDRFEIIDPSVLTVDPEAWGGGGDEFCIEGKYSAATNLKDRTAGGLALMLMVSRDLSRTA